SERVVDEVLEPVEPVDGVGVWPIVEALVPAPTPCEAGNDPLERPRSPPPTEPLGEPPASDVRNDCVASETALGTRCAVSIALDRMPFMRSISDRRASPALAMIAFYRSR